MGNLAVPAPRQLSTDDLLAGPPVRELIVLAGKDSTGKTSAIISLAKFVELGLCSPFIPGTPFYVIDTESKFASILRSWGTEAPRNLVYYPVSSMDEALAALEHVVARHQPREWLAVESAGQLWEKAQDMGYLAEAGIDKLAYLERRKAVAGSKIPPVIPHPDRFWSVVKDAHDTAFYDLLRHGDLNVLITTTVSKPPREVSNRKENATRKDFRSETGVDLNLDGAPTLAKLPETLCLLELAQGEFVCRVIRDNPGMSEDSRPSFKVPDKRSWAEAFWEACRTLKQ